MKRSLLFACMAVLAVQLNAATILVKNMEELNAAVRTVVPGDTILLQNGEWKDVTFRLDCKGTKDRPITIKAQAAGKVLVTGNSKLKIGGEYIVVDGLHFVNGYAGRDAIISFRTDNEHLANHCRVTNSAISSFNNPKRLDENTWIALYGKNNRIDHCNFTDKKNLGVLLAVMLDDERSRENNHLIEYNYFGKRLPLASNGGEIIRVGLSQHCQFNSNTQIVNNLFEECDGEAEVISIKSGSNIMIGNVFKECQGALVLRHGDNNKVLNNIFLGNNKTETGGVRVINKGQKVTGNLFYQCRGTGFRSPLTIMNGIPNSPANRYVQVTDAEIMENTFYECSPLSFCEGSDSERTLPPANVRMEMNTFYNTTDTALFISHDDIGGIRFANNKFISRQDRKLPAGFELINLPADEHFIPRRPRSLQDRGARWFLERPAPAEKKTEVVDCPDAASVHRTLQKQAPLRIRLTGKNYHFSETAIINSNVEFQGTGQREINFGSGNDLHTVFLIKADASLRFSRIHLSAGGVKARSLVSGDTSGSSGHYSFGMEASSVKGFTAAYFFYAPRSSVADSVVVRNSFFDECNSKLFVANAEKEEKGYYNVERIIFSNNHFRRFIGMITDLYRGGKDESTLGPKLIFRKNMLNGCGASTDNAALIKLTGVQSSVIADNDFSGHSCNSPLVEYIDFSRARHLFVKNLLLRRTRILANRYLEFGYDNLLL